MNDLTEKEQLDLMRTWWAENGRYVIGGVVLGVAILYGWNSWRDSIASAELDSSEMYEEVMTNVGEGNADEAEAAATQLFSTYADSVYTAQGRLAMARLYMDNGRDQDAADVLQALVDSDQSGEIGLIGRLRLARVLLYQDKADQVITLLEGHLDNAFGPRFNEVLGDAYAATGAYDDALSAYRAALSDGRSPSVVDNELIQLKINDLPAGDTIDSTNVEAEGGIEVETTEVPATSPETEGDPVEVDTEDEVVDSTEGDAQ